MEFKSSRKPQRPPEPFYVIRAEIKSVFPLGLEFFWIDQWDTPVAEGGQRKSKKE